MDNMNKRSLDPLLRSESSSSKRLKLAPNEGGTEKTEDLDKLVNGDSPSNTKQDSSEDAKEAPVAPASKRARTSVTDSERNFAAFPERLMVFLESNEYEDSIKWNPKGDAFRIMSKGFTEEVLKEHFQGTKFESFTRKLNRWSFKRIVDPSFPPDSQVYHNELFQRDAPQLLAKMKGGGRKKKATLREQLWQEQLSANTVPAAGLFPAPPSGLPSRVGSMQPLQNELTFGAGSVPFHSLLNTSHLLNNHGLQLGRNQQLEDLLAQQRLSQLQQFEEARFAEGFRLRMLREQQEDALLNSHFQRAGSTDLTASMRGVPSLASSFGAPRQQVFEAAARQQLQQSREQELLQLYLREQQMRRY